jgi:uncharacterized membrane protein
MTTRGSAAERTRGVRALTGAGALLGIGGAMFVDETVFHQILRWHHFYDRSTTAAGLISDGVLHAFSFFAAVGGLFWLADLRRRGVWSRRRWWAGVLIGAGGFQLYDGTVQHKLMRLHQIRYDVPLAAYDTVWLVVAVALLAAGAALLLVRRGA